jgi:hypothetical protein
VDRKKKGIVVWMLTWASLLLAVLYSPFGSPDLYSPKKYFSDNQGVIFKNNEITNAPIVKSPSHGENTGFSVPDNATNSSKTHSYTISNTVPTSSNSVAVSSQAINYNQTKNSTQSSGIEQGSFASSQSGTKSNNSGSEFQRNSFISSSNDFNLLATNNLFRQGADAINPLIDTADPGGDPFGPPIPITDGWVFLLGLSVVYVIIKRFFFLKS